MSKKISAIIGIIFGLIAVVAGIMQLCGIEIPSYIATLSLGLAFLSMAITHLNDRTK